LDFILAVLREYGLLAGGVLVIVGSLAGVIKYQNSKLEQAHEREITAIREGHAETIKAMKVDCDRGWVWADAWKQQAERLAERYTEATKLAADMSGEVLERRRTR
jgi:hypothetical protein